MKLLVSLCNQDAQQSQLPGVFLLELDTDTHHIQPLPLEIPLPPSTGGIMGLAHYGEDLLAVTQGETAQLIRLTRQYEVRNVWPLTLVKDAHSLAVADGRAYIASTGTDAVVEFDPRRGERVFWQDNDRGQDSIHLNSVLWHGGQLYATAFGRKKGEEWRSAEDGYLINLTTGRVLAAPLYHPHSAGLALGSTDDRLYFCESQRMGIGREDGQRLRTGSAYTRGLVVTGTHFYVGFSRARLTSRSKNRLACGWMPGTCGVQIYRRGSDALQDSHAVGTISLGAYSNEIYDLLPC